jgi:hypothetical protein
MIYVDQCQSYPSSICLKCSIEWCHMWADSVSELHEMAIKLGLKKSWFQDKRILPHYDLTPNKRTKAIKLGAKEESLTKYFKRKFSPK